MNDWILFVILSGNFSLIGKTTTHDNLYESQCVSMLEYIQPGLNNTAAAVCVGPDGTLIEVGE